MEDCDVHIITGVTWEVAVGGGLGSLFKVSEEAVCCGWVEGDVKKLDGPAAACGIRAVIVE